MPSPTRILYIVSTFCRHEGEMQNPWMTETIRRLRRRGYDLTVLAPSYRGLKDHVVEGVTVHRFRYFLRPWETLTHDEGATNKVRAAALLQLLVFPYIFFGLIAAWRLCRREHFDVIQCHWPFPHGLLGLAGRMGSAAPKPKIVLHFYGAELLLAKTYPLVARVLAWNIGRADANLAISRFTAGRVQAIRPGPVTVIAYGSPLELKPLPPPQHQVKEILTVGRFIERKGVEFLIRAMPLIIRLCPTKLYIVGGGDPGLEARLRAVIAELRLDEAVVLAGKISQSQLVERYRQCDLFCLPAIIDSRGDTEGLGVVLLEAMQYGRPVVASAVGGITDVVRHGETGLLAREKDPADLAEKILAVLRDPALAEKLARQGCAHAQTAFGGENLTAQWEEFYRKVISGP